MTDVINQANLIKSEIQNTISWIHNNNFLGLSFKTRFHHKVFASVYWYLKKTTSCGVLFIETLRTQKKKRGYFSKI